MFDRQVKPRLYMIWCDIFINCNWVATRWQ